MKLVQPRQRKPESQPSTSRESETGVVSPPSDQFHRILRVAQVEMRIGLKRTAIWRRRRAGDFPEPVEIGKRVIGWYEHEIEGDVPVAVEI